MKKKDITESIFRKERALNRFVSTSMFKWWEVQEALKEANIELQEEDVLEVGFEPGFYGEDNSSDACYFIEVKRTRKQTDEEFEEYKQKFEELKEKSKQERYNQYLKLKNEFEPAAESIPGVYFCVICHKNPVDSLDGYYTCKHCLKNV